MSIMACGKTLGHGESCVEGWLCESCEREKILIEALEWYADEKNYKEGSMSEACSDCGQKATEVLKKIKGD